MESNKDEALKCLAIARRHRDAGNVPSARRFAQKSLALFATPEAKAMLAELEAMGTGGGAADDVGAGAGAGSSGAAASSTGAETRAEGEGARRRGAAANGSANGSARAAEAGAQKKRDWTPEQAAVVKRVRACKVTEYYEILAVKRDCDEAEIKKAYRKVSGGSLLFFSSLISSCVFVCFGPMVLTARWFLV